MLMMEPDGSIVEQDPRYLDGVVAAVARPARDGDPGRMELDGWFERGRLAWLGTSSLHQLVPIDSERPARRTGPRA